MVELVLKTDFKGAFDKLAKLPAEVERKALPAALNRAAATARTDMIRRITSEYAIRRSSVSPEIRIIRARGNYPIVIIDPFASRRSGRSLNLIRFLESSVSFAEAKRRRKSRTLNYLRFKIKKASGPKIIRDAFIGNLGRTVFYRTGEPKRRVTRGFNKGRMKEPITGLQTIGVASMFNVRRINKAVIEGIKTNLPIQIDAAIAAALGGYLGQGR